MAANSSLLIAPLRNWSGWCFTTRLFSGSSAFVETRLGAGVDSGVGAGVGVVDARGILGLRVAVVATAVVGVDFTWCSSKAAFRKPYKKMVTSIIEAPPISFRIS
jgi:hypothetical protein